MLSTSRYLEDFFLQITKNSCCLEKRKMLTSFEIRPCIPYLRSNSQPQNSQRKKAVEKNCFSWHNISSLTAVKIGPVRTTGMSSLNASNLVNEITWQDSMGKVDIKLPCGRHSKLPGSFRGLDENVNTCSGLIDLFWHFKYITKTCQN